MHRAINTFQSSRQTFQIPCFSTLGHNTSSNDIRESVDISIQWIKQKALGEGFKSSKIKPAYNNSLRVRWASKPTMNSQLNRTHTSATMGISINKLEDFKKI
jgi:hypothetical protein